MDYTKSDYLEFLNANSDRQSPDISQPFNNHNHLQPCVLPKAVFNSDSSNLLRESQSLNQLRDSSDTHRPSTNPAASAGDVSFQNNHLENSETALPEITTDDPPPSTGNDLIDFGRRSFGREERNHRTLSILDFDPLFSAAPPPEEHNGTSTESINNSAVVASAFSQLQLAPRPPSSIDIFSVEHLENLSRQSPSQSSASSSSVTSPASASPLKTNKCVYYIVVCFKVLSFSNFNFNTSIQYFFQLLIV